MRDGRDSSSSALREAALLDVRGWLRFGLWEWQSIPCALHILRLGDHRSSFQNLTSMRCSKKYFIGFVSSFTRVEWHERNHKSPSTSEECSTIEPRKMVVENPTCSTFWVFLLKNNSHEMIAWSQSCCVGFCSVCMYEVYYWSFVWCQRVWMFWRRRFDFLVGSAMIIIVKTIFCSRSWRAALREKIGRWRSHFLLPTPGWDMVTYY